MIPRFLVGFMFAPLMLAVGCASTETVGGQLNDATLTSRVKARLAGDPEVEATDLDVDTRDGVVTLGGYVDSRDEMANAVEVAESTDGVRRVINLLQVNGESIGEQFSDAAVTSRVKWRLTSDPQVKARNIDVDTHKNVVTLSGLVENQAAKDEALQVARSTEGVEAVRDQLSVQKEPG